MLFNKGNSQSGSRRKRKEIIDFLPHEIAVGEKRGRRPRGLVRARIGSSWKGDLGHLFPLVRRVRLRQGGQRFPRLGGAGSLIQGEMWVVETGRMGRHNMWLDSVRMGGPKLLKGEVEIKTEGT